MLKLLCLSLLVGVVVGQQSMYRMMMMNQLLSGGGAGGSGGAAGSGGAGSGAANALGGAGASLFGGRGGRGGRGGLGGMMNNPLLLCRQTENIQPIPCQNWRNICNIISMRTYKFPNLMSCSPMGVGCCIKDMMSLMFVQRLG